MVKYVDEDIAVVGLGLRFPGDATTPEAFYNLLLSSRSALTKTPADRYNVDAFYHPDRNRLGAVSLSFSLPFTFQGNGKVLPSKHPR
jgi:acyl transferase domain-containing protein